MDITREEIGTLNELLRIKLNPDDYKNQVEAEIKKIQKTLSMPGFRPGHVPVGLVRKRYGKAVLADELNKIVSGSLESFITDSKLDILGSPLPRPSDDSINNWEVPGNFEFQFEIGIAPQFSLTLPPVATFDYYHIEPDEEKVEAYINDTRRKHGKFSNPEIAEADSILYGDLAELNADGTPKEGGVVSRSTVSIAALKDDDTRNRLTGLKKGDQVVINPARALGNDAEEMAYLLNLPAEQASSITSNFMYTVESINKVEPADLNQEFFDKIYGEGNVTSVEAFHDRVKAEIKSVYDQDADMKLKHDIEDYLLHELDIKLPDAFLRKWLQTGVEKPLSAEKVEKDYPAYARGMKLRLIENRIFREQNMQINQEEIREMARQYILHQFSGYGSALTADIMDNLVKRYLEKRESVERIIETLSDRKVFNYLKSVVKTKQVPVSYEQFIELTRQHQHQHPH
jgi:trigger factor